METRKIIRVLFSILVISAFIPLLIFVSSLQGQDSKKIALPNGEEVWDLNGEWDVNVQVFGSTPGTSNYPQIWKITQTGSSFVGIRMIADPYNPKGSKVIQGELDKSGIKKAYIFSAMNTRQEAKGQISDDGHKMNIICNIAELRATRK